MDLPFCKIIVDSRHADTGTNSSFEISLPETLSLPHDAVAYVCDLQVTNNVKRYKQKQEHVLLGRAGTWPTYSQPCVSYKQIVYTRESCNRASEQDDCVANNASNALETFILANDELLQQLFSNIVIFQTHNDNNGIQPWTMNYTNPKPAMS